MSIHVISPVMRKRWGSSCRKLIAIKLADVANDDGSSIYPAVQTIADECELSKRQVQRVMAAFQSEGILIVVKEGGNGPKDTSEYRLDMDAIAALPDARDKGDTQSPITLRKGDTQSQKECHPVTQPVIEPCSSSNEEGHSASSETGADAPSVNALVWKEGLEVLSFQSQNSDSNNRKLIGSWLKLAGASDEAKTKLLGIVRATRAAGTRDPVSYIAKAVNETFPNPSTWPLEKWQRILAIVIERGEWGRELGPEPGKRGCHVPADLMTNDLVAAINKQRVAA